MGELPPTFKMTTAWPHSTPIFLDSTLRPHSEQRASECWHPPRGAHAMAVQPTIALCPRSNRRPQQPQPTTTTNGPPSPRTSNLLLESEKLATRALNKHLAFTTLSRPRRISMTNNTTSYAAARRLQLESNLKKKSTPSPVHFRMIKVLLATAFRGTNEGTHTTSPEDPGPIP